MKKAKDRTDGNVKIMQDKGKEWSEAGNATMQTFSDWLDVSDMESGIPFEHYMTDAKLLLFHIGSLCRNVKSIKTINNFLYKTIIF